MSTSLRSPFLATLAAAVWFALALPGGALASDPGANSSEPFDLRQGTVTGQVIDGSDLRPIGGAQVSIPGLDVGTLTSSDGRFMLVNVPAGTHQLAVQYLGYGRVTREIEVTSGATTNVTVELATAAIALDEVVVSSSPAGVSRRRAIGTNVAAVDVEMALRDAPITSLNDVLQGREPGVVNMAASGSTGTAGLNVLRGITSLTQDNQPLIYIDGVRIDRENRSEVSGTGGQTLSRLNDINPQDIARVEIIKGSAATAMYGSEASSGVIQIFTKRGRPGEVVYDLGVRLGTNRIPELLYQHPDRSLPSANDFVDTGLYQEYTGSVRGASENVSYFVSGSHMDNEGSFVNNSQVRSSGRGNISFTPSETFSGELSSSFSRQRTRLVSNDNVTSGVLTNVYLGNPLTRGSEHDPWGSAFQTVRRELERERYDFNSRYIAGLTLNHQPSRMFSQRLTLGLDYLASGGSSLTPWFEDPGRAPYRGSKSEGRRNTINTNVDYGAAITRQVTDAFEGQLSLGGQFYSREMNNTSASGTDFIAPPLKAIGGTETRGASESLTRYTTGGLFTQLQVGYQDRLFVIVGVRADGSSAFGEDFGFSTFPKASLSYVISDEDWFSLPAVSTLRLRGGWGTAGTQPGAFDKLRLWTTTEGMDGLRGFRPTRVGNAEIGPEVSTEYEAGFDAGLFNERLSLNFTAYHQRTDDILLNFDFPISTGILTSQLRNSGAVRNQGFEIDSNFNLVESQRLRWSMNAGYAFNSNKVLDLAGSPRQIVDRFGTQIVEGYPIAGKWERVIVGYDDAGMPIASDTAVYIGESIPPHTGNLGTDISVGAFTFRATGQYAMGHVVNNHIRAYMAVNRVGEPYYELVERVGGNPDHPDVARFLAEQAIYGESIEDADWFKLREISAGYAVPNAVASRIGATGVRLTAAARNLLTISKYSGIDPEVSSTFSSGNNLSVGADYFTVPPARQFLLGINMTF